ncbi:MAG: DUF2520 domain-containing protein [Bacteroidetes bacterium]|nr:DUF2520 domain-containing protein [Bacteroidota bacterium]MDA1119592.1 DUF2520 domain-containing protein [Bacteroidota bacterium]
MKVTIIGAGNVASHLAPALERAGYIINEVYARRIDEAERISQNLYSANTSDNLDFSGSDSVLFLIAVSDYAIEQIAGEIVLPDQCLIVHTSGSIPMSVLELTASDSIGVLYPLQTFSRNRKISFPEIPILTEANTPEGLAMLEQVGKSLSKRVALVDSEKRLQLHLAAVFVNNFVNHMLTIGDEITSENNLDFSLLEPLIRETVDKAIEIGASDSQTGPAIREDHSTMEMHMELLEENESYQRLYKIISKSIIDSKNL